ncbi:hypothetical protein ACFFGH_28620 [Lysobacter korlensis]|uniref:DUF2207 domain-containing protein n=1 Tax=Lysobacter korlensis TaxID=553636 RepID=A0ABV6RXV0_9GAMM
MNGNTPGFGGSLGWTLILALVIGVGSYLIGLPAALAAVLAAAVGIAGAALSIGGRVQDRRLPDPQIDLRQGARREIKQLSWTAGGQRNRLDEPVVRRLRLVAVARLAARGIDLDDPRHRPRAEQLLGRSTYRVLASPAGQSAAVMQRCIAAIDRLDELPAERTPPTRPATSVPGRTA